ncbi:MAG: hypothetical protein M3460_13285, partial [Actinomycetota bacterium]|nr:hypothetical protein [Actinomycetota bacterium]
MPSTPIMGQLASQRSRSAVVVFVLTVAASIGASGPANGQASGHSDGHSGARELAIGLPPAAGLPPGPLQSKLRPRLSDEHGPVTVFIELAQIPAVDVFSAERRAGRPVPAAARAARAASSQVGQAADRVLDLLRDSSDMETYRGYRPPHCPD